MSIKNLAVFAVFGDLWHPLNCSKLPISLRCMILSNIHNIKTFYIYVWSFFRYIFFVPDVCTHNFWDSLFLLVKISNFGWKSFFFSNSQKCALCVHITNIFCLKFKYIIMHSHGLDSSPPQFNPRVHPPKMGHLL